MGQFTFNTQIAVLFLDHGSNAENYLARTTSLNSLHTNAFGDYIDGLDAYGLFSKFDVLHWYAHQDGTTALLNLVSTSYNGTLHGSPTFNADRGFTGTNGSSTIYIDTGFNPSTATSPQFVQNSAHVSAWSVVDVGATAQAIIGAANAGSEIDIYPKYTDNNAYFRVNSSAIAGVANATPTGHYIANRSSSSAVQGYKNGSSVLSNGSATSAGPPNVNIYTLSTNFNGTAFGSPHQCAMASIGSLLTSTDATNFYNLNLTLANALSIP